MDEFHRGQFEGMVIARLDVLDSTCAEIKHILEKLDAKITDIESANTKLQVSNAELKTAYIWWTKIWAVVISAIVSAFYKLFDR